ncbi:MAG: winged helix-turn-helix transcriptional regulator [Nitrospira sp.]|nr:winged helix-turn-helix transcriptional regulator [Nitrospira sp.]
MTTVSKQDAARAARWFHALSDATRLEIIERLSAGEQCVCDLTDALQIGQSRLSFHLKTLKDAGILQDRREGRWIYYALNQETIKEAAEFVKSLKSPGSGSSAPSRSCE